MYKEVRERKKNGCSAQRSTDTYYKKCTKKYEETMAVVHKEVQTHTIRSVQRRTKKDNQMCAQNYKEMLLEVYTDVQRNAIRSVQSTKKYNQKCTKNYEEQWQVLSAHNYK